MWRINFRSPEIRRRLYYPIEKCLDAWNGKKKKIPRACIGDQMKSGEQWIQEISRLTDLGKWCILWVENEGMS